MSKPIFQNYYLINGAEISFSDILAIDPLSRTLIHWSILVDWERQKRQPFVVVDPYDPRGLLYLGQQEYLTIAKIAKSNDLPVLVVARPGDSPVAPSRSSSTDSENSQNSPWEIPWRNSSNYRSKWYRRSATSWKQFVELRNSIATNVNRVIGGRTVSDTDKTVSRTLYMWARALFHYAEVKNPDANLIYLHKLAQQVSRVFKYNGPLAGVTYLKVSLFVLYSFIAGNPVKCTLPLGIGIRLTNGLPSSWGKLIRARIRSNELNWIRVMASLLNAYKALDVKIDSYNLSTIKQPHPTLEGPLWKQFCYFCEEVFPFLLKQETGLPSLEFQYESAKGLWMQAAGANASISIFSLVRDAHAWADLGPDHDYIAKWLSLHNDVDMASAYALIKTEYHQCEKGPTGLPGKKVRWDDTPTIASAFGIYKMPKSVQIANDNDTILPLSMYEKEDMDIPSPCLGRLHAIQEPAGKVRIVAIADYWTQLCLKPIHDHLFKILRQISTDATFDQTGRVEAYYQRGLKPHWSFDLKAATDTIPLGLYKQVLRPLLKNASEEPGAVDERISLWAAMLTDRLWITPKGDSIRYGCGQPMGAYSSWASMAIVHHALVQFSAWRAEKTDQQQWYKEYLVLGDDVDIAKCHDTAQNYQTSCAEFKVVIGLLKSLQSEKNCFEFANRRFHPSGDISPISLKEEISSQSWTGRVAFANRIIARFGTSLKDRASAVMRKASTVVQWHVISSLLSKVSANCFLPQFYRFCLVNPFTDVSSGEIVTIDAILKWIRLILPNEGRDQLDSVIRSPGKMKEVGEEFTQRILKEIEAKILERIGDIPLTFAKRECSPLRSLVAIPINLISSFPTQLTKRTWEKALNPSNSDVSHRLGEEYGHAHTALEYIYYSINLRNQQILSELKELHAVVLLVKKLLADEDERSLMRAKWRSNPGSPGIYMIPKGHELTEVLRLWFSFSSVPQYVVPDPNRPLNEWLKPEPEFVPGINIIHGKKECDAKEIWRFEESLKAPMSILDRLLARQVGILVPTLPYLKMRPKGEQWTSFLVYLQKAYFEDQVVEPFDFYLELIASFANSNYAFTRDSRKNVMAD